MRINWNAAFRDVAKMCKCASTLIIVILSTKTKKGSGCSKFPYERMIGNEIAGQKKRKNIRNE